MFLGGGFDHQFCMTPGVAFMPKHEMLLAPVVVCSGQECALDMVSGLFHTLETKLCGQHQLIQYNAGHAYPLVSQIPGWLAPAIRRAMECWSSLHHPRKSLRSQHCELQKIDWCM
jgi:hypothetical protein